jgi:transposase
MIPSLFVRHDVQPCFRNPSAFFNFGRGFSEPSPGLFLGLLSRDSRFRGYRRTELHVILDNSSTHKTPEVKAWLEAHPLVHFHFTPTGASWLNMVEAWFSILTRKSVRRGSFDSVKALVKHIRNYIEHWNNNAVPFIWTREPAELVKKSVRRPR